MKTIYLDIFSGISGDMFLGAMLDLGVDLHALEHELEKLRIDDDFHLHAGRASRSQIEGVKFDVHLTHEHQHSHEHVHADGTHHAHAHSHGHSHSHGHDAHDQSHSHGAHDHSDEHQHEHEHARSFSEIKKLISRSTLSKWVKEKSLAVFQRIATAEGRIHGMAPDKVHFHEVGAVDSIVDIVGACVALEMLGQPRVLASEVVDGAGWIQCAHGRFPIPAPATLEILASRAVSISQCDEPNELITPTGAALLAEFVERFGPMQNFTVQRVGFGIGTRENKTRPNVLRAVLGETTTSATHDWESDTIAVLETNLDDVTPEIVGAFVEKALKAGALDVFHTPIQMKKNRPGVLLSVLCVAEESDNFCELILRETSAFGVRRSTAQRRKLRREFREVKTSYGPIQIKLGMLDGEVIHATPEFQSCKQLAEEKNVPLKKIYDAALAKIGSLTQDGK
jgi:uncharacterized protein (TIGR00299 family) protein